MEIEAISAVAPADDPSFTLDVETLAVIAPAETTEPSAG
jgi:hypothetical protein